MSDQPGQAPHAIPNYAHVPAGARPAPTPPLAAEEIHLLDRLAILYRYRNVAVAVFVLTTLAMIIQGYSNVQYFQTHARLLIEDERSTSMPGINAGDSWYYQDPEPYRQTQFRILKGRDLSRRVIKRLKVQDLPEFNGSAPPPGVTLHGLVDTVLRRQKTPQPAAHKPEQL